MTLLEKIEQNKEDLINIRHQIHRHPETAFEEIETTKLIKKVLDDAGIENHPNGDSTGVIGLIHGAKEPRFHTEATSCHRLAKRYK